MEIKVLIAGCLAAFVVFGHFVFGIKWYLKPVMDSELPLIPKATMQSVFHYISVFLVLSAVVLLLVGLGIAGWEEHVHAVKFIGLNYTLFAVVQIVYSVKNKVANPLIKMFQWTLFLPIGLLCLL